MKTIRTLITIAAVALVAACATAPPADLAAQMTLQLQTARAAVDMLAAANHVDPAKVVAVRGQVDAAIALLATVGSVTSLADPKLAPAIAALNTLNATIAAANAPPVAPGSGASAPAGG